jgi:hypothetical protein
MLGLLILFGLVILFTLLGTLYWGNKNPDGVFLTCGDNEVQIGWSEDGITWTAGTHVEGGLPFGTGGIAYYLNKGNKIWVAGGKPAGDRTRQLIWSDDSGKNWNDSTGEQFGSNSNAFARFLLFAGGRWVAGGSPTVADQNIVVYSNDGKNWSAVNDQPFGTGAGTVGGISHTNDKWFLCGKGSTGAVVKIWSSSDGINWTPADGTPFGTNVGSNPDEVLYGNGVYVAVGGSNENGSLWRSTDGQTWSEATVNPFTTVTTASTRSAVFYDGMFVVAGSYVSDGTISAWSTDGDTWVAGTGLGTLSSGYRLNKILPPSNKTNRWIAGGATSSDSLGYYSLNGKDWTVITNNFFDGGDIQDFVNSWSGRTVGVGKATGSDNVYYTNDRITWTESDSIFGSGTSNTLLEVRYG